MKRTVFIGDVHGCYDEFCAILDRLRVTASDRLISVGDLICKGPHTAKVLDLAMMLSNLTCVMGNHEYRFLTEHRAGRIPNIKPYDRRAVRDMGKRFSEYMRYIASWPYYIDTPRYLVVHAGLMPGIAARKQRRDVLTGIRYVEPEHIPWYAAYRGKKPVIYGHWVRRKTMIANHTIGLDTGCVYGGKLSAYVLPDKRTVSVRARKVYRRRKKWGE